MSGTHPDPGPELRALAQTLLDRLEPAIRFAAARAQSSADNPGRCQQVWCPVCALAALAGGEQHPMLDVVAEQGAALMTVLRAMVDDLPTSPPDDGPPEPPPDGPPDGPGRYQHIPVIIEE